MRKRDIKSWTKWSFHSFCGTSKSLFNILFWTILNLQKSYIKSRVLETLLTAPLILTSSMATAYLSNLRNIATILVTKLLSLLDFTCFPTNVLFSRIQYRRLRSTMGFLVVIFVTESCLFCGPMDCSLPGSSVHGISQARMLQWDVISFSRGSSQPRGQACTSCTGRRVLCHWATRVARRFS